MNSGVSVGGRARRRTADLGERRRLDSRRLGSIERASDCFSNPMESGASFRSRCSARVRGTHRAAGENFCPCRGSPVTSLTTQMTTLSRVALQVLCRRLFRHASASVNRGTSPSPSWLAVIHSWQPSGSRRIRPSTRSSPGLEKCLITCTKPGAERGSGTTSTLSRSLAGPSPSTTGVSSTITVTKLGSLCPRTCFHLCSSAPRPRTPSRWQGWTCTRFAAGACALATREEQQRPAVRCRKA